MSDVLVRLGSSLVEKFSMAFIEVEFHGDNPCQTPKSEECSKQGAIKKQIPLNKNSEYYLQGTPFLFKMRKLEPF